MKVRDKIMHMKRNFSKNLFFLSIFLFSVFYFLSPSLILAQTVDTGIVPNCGATSADGKIKECTFEDFVHLAQNVAAKIVVIGLVLSPIIFAYAGYLYLTSGGDVGKRKTANKIFWNVAIGIFIMLLAWLIVNLIMTALVCGNVSGGNWFNVSTCPSSQTK